MSQKLDCIEIRGDEGFPPKYFNFSAQYKDDVKKVLVPHGLIADRIDALAKQIFEDYTRDADNTLHCLCVLKGGFKFFAELSEYLTNMNRSSNKHFLKMTYEFIRLKSYVNTESTGHVEVTDVHNQSFISGNNVLIIEDLIDTGKSMMTLIPFIESFSPKSVKCCSLLLKRTTKSVGYIPDYLGFSVPDDFIIGYAIDYNDQFRDLEHICAISDSAIEKYKKKK